jgi:hypothetical protein
MSIFHGNFSRKLSKYMEDDSRQHMASGYQRKTAVSSKIKDTIQPRLPSRISTTCITKARYEHAARYEPCKQTNPNIARNRRAYLFVKHGSILVYQTHCPSFSHISNMAIVGIEQIWTLSNTSILMLSKDVTMYTDSVSCQSRLGSSRPCSL